MDTSSAIDADLQCSKYRDVVGIAAIGQVTLQGLTLQYSSKAIGLTTWGVIVPSSSVSALFNTSTSSFGNGLNTAIGRILQLAPTVPSSEFPTFIGTATCRWYNNTASADTQFTHTLSNCSFDIGIFYTVLIYSTAASGDRALYGFSFLSPSNGFVSPPRVIAYSASGLSFQVSPRTAGELCSAFLSLT